MKRSSLPEEVTEQLLLDQLHEIEAYTIYTRLAETAKRAENADILHAIASDELSHYQMLQRYTGSSVRPRKLVVLWHYVLARLFGLTFALKLMEIAEQKAQKIDYKDMDQYVPEVSKVLQDEEEHEHQLLDMLNEQRLDYMGSIVLGLNDALVELTGALAGLTFAFQNTRIIALSGLITGIAASLSMASSEYLAKKTDNRSDALRSALYTGLAYIITVALLIMPYMIFSHYLLSLTVTLLISILIIMVFNFYISVAKNYAFLPRFLEMAGISLGVAALSFAIGLLINLAFGIDV